MKYKRIVSVIWIFIFTLTLFLSYSNPVYAASVIAIDEDEYNLYVDEYPDGIYENIYAKLKTPKSNSDDYYLNLSSYDSEEIFTAALESANINYSDKWQVSMTASLFRQGDEEDKKVTDTVQLLLPLPDDAQAHPEDTVFYSVSGGKAKPFKYTLVEADDVKYAQFTLSSYTTYGFLFNDPDSYEEEEYEEEEYEEEEIEEEEEFEEEKIEEEIEETPTSAPTQTPTDIPKKDPTPTPDSQTNNPISESDVNTSSKNTSARQKDSVPKTGDDFPLTELITGSLLSACILGFVIYKLKK